MPHVRSNVKAKEDRPELYTIGEAAKFLGRSVNTIKNQRRLGIFPAPVAYNAKGWNLWDLAQLRAVLAQRGQPKENRQNS